MEECASGVASSLMINRIFIGGLSTSVTAADLEKTFLSLGRVHNMEFVRSNGRSFAFMDFEPNSDKALAKLFAVYNGCTWKGGKLRLEKAKEHYLARLKREWAEDVEVNGPPDLDIVKSSDHSDKSVCLSQENANLRIFFPKLRKVKTLSYKGTGKHKYSFQRVVVPSLPIHFCDCEEHCGPSETANETYISALNSAAYEKEQSIMTSVMNKLLEKEENEVPASVVKSVATQAIIVNASDDDIKPKQTEEAQETDADFVTNIGVGESDDMLMQLLGKKAHSVDQVQESRTGIPQPFTEGLCQKKAHSLKRQKITTTVTSEVTSSQATSPTVVGTEDEFASILTRSEDLKDDKGNKILAEDSAGKNQTEYATATVISATSNTWIQKSSWRDLVGESGSSTFSISHVLPCINSIAPTVPNAKDSVTKPFAEPKKRKREPDGEGSTDVKEKQNTRLEKIISSSLPRVPGNIDRRKATTDTTDGEHLNNLQGRSIPKINIGEVCTFMRNAESEKEWLKAKATLSGYLKKKGGGTNASKEPKLKPSRR
ncbi:hypothetical protein MUK42_11778 [Musa troglodytarum]|uniref:RRM domain-containing protein n=1 Tax=Musa troglodytarum TaxID=320322 RepID=A0A9E7KI21_9LILI|nr:hypothetical protein MUK42_11778 [Musa troglodytarum]URE16280.1 hypothetical protein MUK42_11778 [Musa troglodytarum]